ncbi:ABC transporter substrate-binding protein, partial [Helicobacter pylori]|nr:ABC transporter substrate-binding protein [Helicobacter pylori]
MLIARFKKSLISYSLGALIVSSFLLGVANASNQEV